MKPDCLILRFGEMMLKGKNRKRFEHSVMIQIRKVLSSFPDIRYIPEFGRVYVELGGAAYEPTSAALQRVFGLASFSPAFHAPLELEAIQETALRMMQALPKQPATFKVTVRRVNKSFPHDSQQMNYLVGGYVLQAIPGLQVDVKKPEVELRVEIREDKVLLYVEVIAGAGGFPSGTSGKALLMLSGGIDSPVAGWLAMRKGLTMEAIHFHSYPYTSERAKDKVIELAHQLAGYTDSLKLHLVSFTEVQTSIHRAYQDNLLVTLIRRAMYRIAERVAEREGLSALVTGESLGQVASQTLPSLNVIGRVVTLPLLQPLMMMDKQEIIGLAENIGTFPISILPYEDCCSLFLPPSPSTNPNLRLVENLEESMDFLNDLIDKAVLGTETIEIVHGQLKKETNSHLF
ncbi:tRNA 4-thiouridine(8) synthase ThiI [Paenibacillus pectinilyticus]|uniref:Probable tRNA sulfurtransferase n=1 Tax=Paenibacillus pectinilyticus TaxID=512399 RepID=A0A1C1A959_9BACL|nr:tRNA uracil 4-sulfurtransferase ThiI [Paenibacillus pectinilyticus]OCT17130.1 tRNA 4-thiouridine(8) synthase ThiI [Paenibacillus pectinilyticus]